MKVGKIKNDKSNKKFVILSESIEINRTNWTPILYFKDKNPSWIETDKIQLTGEKTKRATVLEALRTEITASKWMASDHDAVIHNQALSRAIDSIKLYQNGDGLFQASSKKETIFEIE